MFTKFILLITVQPEAERTNLKKILGLIFKNDQLTCMLVMALAYNIASNIIQGFAIYYFSYVMNNADLSLVYVICWSSKPYYLNIFPSTG
jgi:Na+/melibiose symporter-like transporter